jgi:hypothetical protein
LLWFHSALTTNLQTRFPFTDQETEKWFAYSWKVVESYLRTGEASLQIDVCPLTDLPLSRSRVGIEKEALKLWSFPSLLQCEVTFNKSPVFQRQKLKPRDARTCPKSDLIHVISKSKPSSQLSAFLQPTSSCPKEK